ncbi:MAG: V-type ATP synthase subunit I [Elusimicrobia bacterium]|nr:V-type ATP synthase subunit I [Elusimicrobiota bacterium]
MSIVRMKKLQLFAHKEIKQQLLSFLQQQGVIQLRPLEPDQLQKELLTYSPVSSQEIDETLHTLKHMVAFLQKHSQVRIPGQIMLDHQQWTDITQRFNFQECFYRCRKTEDELGKLENKKQQLGIQQQQLVPWLEVETRLQDLQDGVYVAYLAGSVKKKKQAECLKELTETIPALYHEIVSQDKNKSYVVIAILHEDRGKTSDLLKKYDFSQSHFPKIKVTPKRLQARLTQELKRSNKILDHLLQEISLLSQNLPKLVALIDYYQNVRENKIVQKWFLESSQTFIISGWIPAKQEAPFQKELYRHFQEVELITVDPGPDDNPPVEIENKKMVKPFEVITELYGYPVYKGIDPTVYLAPFFALFFGICLGDAGYGLVVAIVTAALSWKMRSRLTPNSWRFLNLFFIGGLCAILAGLAMGSYFGVGTSFKLFDPLSQLTIFLGLAFTLGLIHVFTGLVLKMRDNIRDNSIWAGLWDQGSWMILIVSLLVLGWAKTQDLSATIATGSSFIAIMSAAWVCLFQARGEDKNSQADLDCYQVFFLGLSLSLACWFLKIKTPFGLVGTLLFLGLIFYFGRKNIKGIFARVGLGLFNLYGITSYLGDVLSYSRLVALGLGGGVIAMVINTMAGLTANSIPVVGLILAGLILLFGHAFNLTMSLLSAFVHTSRLQYVEFFGKFYSSGGKKFKPFNWTYNNVILVDKLQKTDAN